MINRISNKIVELVFSALVICSPVLISHNKGLFEAVKVFFLRTAILHTDTVKLADCCRYRYRYEKIDSHLSKKLLLILHVTLSISDIMTIPLPHTNGYLYVCIGFK